MQKQIVAIVLSFLLALPPAFSQSSDLAKALVGATNLLENPGFEAGRGRWVASTPATVTLATNGSNLLVGKGSAVFDATASAQFIESQLYAIPEGLKGRNCLARIQYKGGDTNLTFKLINDASVELMSVTLAVASTMTPATLNFGCPTSGSVKIRVESTGDAALLALDQAYLGHADNLGEVAQRNVGEIFAVAAATCPAGSIPADGGSRSSSRFVSLSSRIGSAHGNGSTAASGSTSDAGCPGATGCFNVPDLRGRFLRGVDGGVGRDPDRATRSAAATGGNSGDNVGSVQSDAYQGHWHVLGNSSGVQGNSRGTTTAASGSLAAAGTGSASVDLQRALDSTNDGGNGAPRTTSETRPANTAVLYCIQTQGGGQLAFQPHQVGWRVDANISGANPSLGVTSVSSYTEITDSALTLTQNSGSISAGIACSSTNASTVGATTCAAGSESIGVTFNAPAPGAVLACASFGHSIATSTGGTVNGAFQIVETPSNAQTILQEGKSKVSSAIATGGTTAILPHRLCGTFEFASAGQKTLRLMYEQLVSGTVSSVSIPADGIASVGQRDIRWEIMPITQSIPAPLLVGSVVSPGNNGVTRINTVLTQSSNYTATESDETIVGTATLTLSLPAASTLAGKKFHLATTGSGIMTVDPSGSETICGVSTILVRGSKDALVIQSTGTEWIAVDGSRCMRTESAYVTNAGVVTESTGDWINGNCSVSTSTYTCAYNSNTFSSAPYCTASVQTDANYGVVLTSFTTSQFVARTRNNSSSSDQAAAFSVICHGPR